MAMSRTHHILKTTFLGAAGAHNFRVAGYMLFICLISWWLRLVAGVLALVYSSKFLSFK